MADVRLTATNPADSSVVPVACNEKGELLLEEPIYVEGPTGPKGDKGDPGDPGDPFTGTFSGDVTFDGSLDLQKPETCKSGQSYLSVGQFGSLTTFGFYKITLSSNGFVDFQDKWQSFSNNGEVGSAWISLTPGGAIEFRNADSWPSGSNYSPPMSMVVHGSGDISIGHWSPASLLDVNGEVTLVSRGVSYTIVEQSGLAHLVPVETARKPYIDEAGVEHPPVEPAVVDRPALRDIPGEVTMLEEQLQKVMERLKMSPEAGWEVWDGAS